MHQPPKYTRVRSGHHQPEIIQSRPRYYSGSSLSSLAGDSPPNGRSASSHSSSTLSRETVVQSPPPQRTVPLKVLHPQRDRWVSLVLSVIAVAPFAALAVAAVWYNNRIVSDREWEGLQVGMKVAVTLFPVVFAAIAGRMIRKIAQLRLEHGASLISLEQLMGSVTVFGAATTQWAFLSFNLLGLALILLWSLSPLGAQSALRILNVGFHRHSTPVQLSYLDVNGMAQSANISSGGGAYDGAADKLYLSALIAANRTQSFSTDLWGHLKLPSLRALEQNTTANASGWRDTANQNTLMYPSLLGIPVSGLQTGNTTFELETSYLEVDCFNLTNTTYNAASPNRYQYFQYLNPVNSSAMFEWSSYNDDNGITAANCSVSVILVEVAVICHRSTANINLQGGCSVTAIRSSDSQLSTTLEMFSNNQSFAEFASNLVAATPMGHPDSPLILDNYLANPASPLGDFSSNIALFTLGEATFSERLTQVVNSYYLARQGFETYTAQGAFSNESSFTMAVIASTSGVNTEQEIVQRSSVNWGWLVVFLLATATMILASGLTLAVASQTLNPDLLGYVSTMTRDNPYVEVNDISSTDDAISRARKLTDVVIRLGDVAPKDPGVGELGVGMLSSTERSEISRYYR